MATNSTSSWLVSPSRSPQILEDEQVMSDDQLHLADSVLFVIRYVVICSAIPLTLCNIVVFLHRNMRSATTVYIVGLSCGQLMNVLCITVQHLCRLTFSDPLNSWSYWTVSLYFGIYCGIVARRGAHVVMSLVSVERLYAIVHPLHVRRFLLSRRPLPCLILAYVIAAILHIYILAKTEIRGITVGISVVYRPVPTQLYRSHKAINDMFSLGTKVLLTYCTLLTQIFLNVLTIYFLRRHNVAAKAMKSSVEEDGERQRERQMTVTILGATFSYVLLSLPSAMQHFVYSVYPRFNRLSGPYRNLHDFIGTLTFILSVLSYCVDFVCFMVLSSNYRTTFLTILGLKKKRRTEATVAGLSKQQQQ
ncbi:hypothetical protein ACOMHN_023914 [Nucella lapillus]